jgi:hypothetical protein
VAHADVRAPTLYGEQHRGGEERQVARSEQVADGVKFRFEHTGGDG